MQLDATGCDPSTVMILGPRLRSDPEGSARGALVSMAALTALLVGHLPFWFTAAAGPFFHSIFPASLGRVPRRLLAFLVLLGVAAAGASALLFAARGLVRRAAPWGPEDARAAAAGATLGVFAAALAVIGMDHFLIRFRAGDLFVQLVSLALGVGYIGVEAHREARRAWSFRMEPPPPFLAALQLAGRTAVLQVFVGLAWVATARVLPDLDPDRLAEGLRVGRLAMHGNELAVLFLQALAVLPATNLARRMSQGGPVRGSLRFAALLAPTLLHLLVIQVSWLGLGCCGADPERLALLLLGSGLVLGAASLAALLPRQENKV